MDLVAKEDLISAVLRCVASERMEPHAYFDAELEYCNEAIIDAARRLVAGLEGSV